MTYKSMAAMAAGLALAISAGAASAACKLVQEADYPITVEHNQPLIDVVINGRPTRLMVDLGADKTMLFAGGAQKLGLQVATASADGDVTAYGVGGSVTVGSVHIQEFKLGDYKITNFDLFALRDRPGNGDVVGVLGEDFLENYDLELDFPHGALRLFKPQDCSGDEVVYWPGNYSVVHADRGPALVPVQLNGSNFFAMLDSGSPISYVTTEAARRAGVTPQSPETRDGGATKGIGSEAVAIKIARFKTFAMGQETVSNIPLRLGDLFGADKEVVVGSHIATQRIDWPEMLIGMDFMKSHRILIARSQQKIYFSYVGGPVFVDPGPVRAPTPPAPKP